MEKSASSQPLKNVTSLSSGNSAIPDDLEWLYQAPTQSSVKEQEAFLLGKPIPGSNPNEINTSFSETTSNASPWNFHSDSSKVNHDAVRKIREDPLYVIRQAEQRRALKEKQHPILNPTTSSHSSSLKATHDRTKQKNDFKSVFKHTSSDKERVRKASLSTLTHRRNHQKRRDHQITRYTSSSPTSEFSSPHSHSPQKKSFSPSSQSHQWRHSSSRSRCNLKSKHYHHRSRSPHDNCGIAREFEKLNENSTADKSHQKSYQNASTYSRDSRRCNVSRQPFQKNDRHFKSVYTSAPLKKTCSGEAHNISSDQKHEIVVKSEFVQNGEQVKPSTRMIGPTFPEDWVKKEDLLQDKFDERLGPPQAMIKRMEKIQSMQPANSSLTNFGETNLLSNTTESSTDTLSNMLERGRRHEDQKRQNADRLSALDALQENLEKQWRKEDAGQFHVEMNRQVLEKSQDPDSRRNRLIKACKNSDADTLLDI